VEPRDWISLVIWIATMVATISVMWGTHRTEVRQLKQLIEDGQAASNKYLESRLANLQQQITEMDKRRADEFLRLHAKAGDAVKATYDNMLKANEQFVTKSEFALLAQHVQVLESRLNK
jgi:hypothetical protein